MNKKTLTFGLFLIFSFAVWMGGKLTSTYEDSAIITLKFEDLPPATRLPIGFEKEINIKLLARGYVFLLNRWFGSTLHVDLSKTLIEKNNRSYLFAKDLLPQIENEFPKNTKIINVEENEIEILLERIKFKTITLKINPESKLPQGYFFVHPPIISPTEITVTGPDDELDKLNQIITENIDFKIHLNENKFSSNLILPKNSKLTFSTKKVQIEQEIDRYIEIIQSVDLQAINIPRETELLLFPKKIDLTYKLGFKSAGKFKSNTATVFIDYNQFNDKQTGYSVNINNLPDYIIGVRLNPSKVDAYIKKSK